MQKNLFLIVGGIFLFCGLAFIGVGSALHVSFSRFKETARPATAVITEIIVTRSGSGSRAKTSHEVHVEYEVDGARYNQRLPSYWSGMREGQEIDVLYNPADPTEVNTAEGGWLFLIFVGIGFVFAVLGAILVYVDLRKRRHVKQLLATGQAVSADVLEIYMDDSLTRKSRGRRSHPYRVLSEWTNPADGVRHQFESDPLWDHPGEIASVIVHFNPSDPQDYVVSADGGADAVPLAFDVILKAVPDSGKKISVINAVREITGLGLKDAMDLVEQAPSIVREKAPKEEADMLKQQLEEAGGEVELE